MACVMPLQVIFSALADGGPSSATTADSLQRLLQDVFQRDVREFRRDYSCAAFLCCSGGVTMSSKQAMQTSTVRTLALG